VLIAQAKTEGPVSHLTEVFPVLKQLAFSSAGDSGYQFIKNAKTCSISQLSKYINQFLYICNSLIAFFGLTWQPYASHFHRKYIDVPYPLLLYAILSHF
jgi:hypothetical protein